MRMYFWRVLGRKVVPDGATLHGRLGVLVAAFCGLAVGCASRNGPDAAAGSDGGGPVEMDDAPDAVDGVDAGPAGCAGPGACASGMCADGYCCTAPCTGPCEACNLAGREGVCSPVTSSDDADTCAGAYTCDVGGRCGAKTFPNGASCKNNSECLSTFCVDDVCCGVERCSVCGRCVKGTGSCATATDGSTDPDSCYGLCFGGACCDGCWDGAKCEPGETDAACGVRGVACTACGSCRDCVYHGCAPVQNREDADSCKGAVTCDVLGRCRGAVGAGCSKNDDCASGHCEGSICAKAIVVDVSVGRGSTCAVRTDGNGWCWGANGLAQLGSGWPTSPQVSPTQVWVENDAYTSVSVCNRSRLMS